MSTNVKKRKQFSLKEKLKILEEVDKGLKKSDIAKKLSISASTLSTFIKGRNKIEKKRRIRFYWTTKKKNQNG